MVNRNRRETEWYSLDRTFATLGSGVQSNELLFGTASVASQQIKGTTITRMLIDMYLKADSVAQLVNLYWGIVVLNRDAVVAGAFPEADDVSDRAGWMVRGKLNTIQDSLSDSSQWARRTLDIRSQRLMRNEEDELQLVVDASSSGFILQWAAYIRVLVKWR